MTRLPRFSYAGAIHHVTMRCNNKEFLFDEQSQRLFLEVLKESSLIIEVDVYGYCLMTNHLHLLLLVCSADQLSRFMHRLANVFAKRFNTLHGRKGHLWEGRFRSTIVELGSCLLRCLAFIDLNPVRAGIVQQPDQYRWSSHNAIATEDESIITLHETYRALGSDASSRYNAYSREIEAESAREAYSLANVLFLGRHEFIDEQLERFGLTTEGTKPHLQRVALDNVIWAIVPVSGGSRKQANKASGDPDGDEESEA